MLYVCSPILVVSNAGDGLTASSMGDYDSIKAPSPKSNSGMMFGRPNPMFETEKEDVPWWVDDRGSAVRKDYQIAGWQLNSWNPSIADIEVVLPLLPPLKEISCNPVNPLTMPFHPTACSVELVFMMS